MIADPIALLLQTYHAGQWAAFVVVLAVLLASACVVLFVAVLALFAVLVGLLIVVQWFANHMSPPVPEHERHWQELRERALRR